MLLKENLKGLQHIGIPVTDIGRSKAFYFELGFSEVMYTEIPEQNETIKVTMLTKDELTLELFQLTSEQCKEIAARQDGHVDHIALDVMDIDKAYEEMRNSGWEIIEKDAPAFLPFWKNGVKYFSVRGPNGEKIEFNQKL